MQPETTLPRPDSESASVKPVTVWDLPLRIFHWLLAALVVTAAVSGEIGGNAMDIHMQAGYAVAILLLFRLLWGFVGTPHARFSSFVRGVPSILAYCRSVLRGEEQVHAGHNPLGGWMVVIMLIALAAQAGTGLFANDDIMTEGPLFNLVSKDTSDTLSAIHKLVFKPVAGLASIHILAILYYLLVKRIDLVRPMITGRKLLAPPHWPAMPSRPGRTNAFALALLASSALSFYFFVLRQV